MSLLALSIFQAMSRLMFLHGPYLLNIPVLPLTSWEQAGSHKPAGDTYL